MMNRKKIRWGLFPLLILLLGWGAQSYAACTRAFVPARLLNVTVNFGEVTVDNSLTNGTVVYSGNVAINPSSNPIYLVQRTSATACDGTLTNTNMSGWAITQNLSGENGGLVFRTNVPGISIRLITSFGVFMPIETRNVIGGENVNYPANQNLSFDIIKTGPVVSGPLKSGLWVNVNLNIAGLGVVQGISLSGSSTNRITAFTPTCAVDTANIDVPLGRTPAGDFSGIGSTPRTKGFTLGLACYAGVNMAMTLNATQSAETTDNSVIALNGPNAAKGVGIQVLYNNNLVRLGQRLPLGTSYDGINNFSFIARYVQTQPKITGGPANATATFTMTYQ
jgi:type 1 fimbria pilin